jgi:hypothetical protein
MTEKLLLLGKQRWTGGKSAAQSGNWECPDKIFGGKEAI